MKKILSISVMSLLVLAALSFSDTGRALAQKKANKGHHKEYKDKKGGPPDWAPAHGYRRKMGEDDHDKSDKWRGSDKERKLERREIELKRREAELNKREAGLKRREKASREQPDAKKRPSEVLEKRRTTKSKEKPGSLERHREILKEKTREAKERSQETEKESRTGNKDWDGGSNW